jgi:hypothetical protein
MEKSYILDGYSKNLNITFLILIFTILISVPSVSAIDYDLDFATELVDGNAKFVDLDTDVSIDRSLVMHVTITNPNDIWINIGQLSWVIESSHNTKEFNKMATSESMENVLILPKDKEDIYIILDGYNSLENGDRIGSWLIDFEGHTSQIDCFGSNNLEKIGYCSVNPLKANPLDFSVTKESPKVNGGFDIGRNLSKLGEFDSIWAPILVLCAIAGLYFKYKKRK